jgi:cytochrome c oxidase subunit 4
VNPADHIVPLKTYFAVFAALLALLALTVGVSLVDLGEWNVVVAMAVAFCKAILVVLFFMHVKYSPRLTWVFAGGGVLWLAILLLLLLPDFMTR